MPVTSRGFRAAPFGAAVAVASATMGIGAQESAERGDTTLARQVTGSHVSLARGVSVARTQGTPISGTYELERGTLQLSVYTGRGGRFWEVIVDPRTGRIANTEEIKQGEDLTAARSQGEAMSRAQHSLRDAVGRALRRNCGYHAVSVAPTANSGHPVATIELVRGTSPTSIWEDLH